MTATIGSLLDRFHQTAYALGDTRKPRSVRVEAARQRQGWSRLSRAFVVVLGRLPFEAASPARSVSEMVSATLDPLVVRPLGRPVSPSGLEDLAECVGAIGDLLVDRPSSKAWRRPSAGGVEGPVSWPLSPDERAAAGLQGSLLAGLYAAARWSAGRVASDPDAVDLTRVLGRVWRVTEPYALTPVAERSSSLEYLAISSRHERSMGGALREWERWATVSVEPLQATRSVFEGLAADLTILNAALLHGVHGLAEAGYLDPTATATLDESVRRAHAAWKGLSTWPDVLTVEGRRHLGLVNASRLVRVHVGEQFRSGNRWLTPRELALVPAADLAVVTYALARTASWAGEAVARSLEEVVVNRSRLWHHASEVEELGHHEIAWVRSPTGDVVSTKRLPGDPSPISQLTRGWTVYPERTDLSRELAARAAGAGEACRDVYDRVRSSLGQATPPETVAGLSLVQGRVQAVAPELGRTPRSDMGR